VKRVVLVRPEGPRNLGTVVRAVANFGPAEVVLVAPVRPSLLIHPEYEQMSHGVEDVAERCRVVGTLDEALADCHDSIAFTARDREHRVIETWSAVRGRARAAADDTDRRVALVFGNETSGLTREEADRARTLAHVPTSAEHTSLNLGVAVAIVLYSLFEGETPASFGGLRSPVTGRDREFLKRHVQDVLSAAARSEPARLDILDAVDRLFSHGEIENRDARAWHAVMRALGNRKSPMDYGLARDANAALEPSERGDAAALEPPERGDAAALEPSERSDAEERP